MSSVKGYVKYKGAGEEEEGALMMSRSRKNDTKRYVYVCAMFASLNSVLLGYGNIFFSFKNYLVVNGHIIIIFFYNSMMLGAFV